MATQAAEVSAVADHAAGLVEVEFARGVVADEIGGMAGRFEIGVLGVAFLATKGVIDIAMADDAIGHFGHIRRADLYRIGQSAVAGLAGIAGVEMTADVVGRLKVGLFVDGGGQEGRDVAHLQVQGVVEGYDACRGRGGYLGIFVARAASGFDGQEIVGGFGAGGGRGVAGGALQFEIQVELMREGRGIGRAPRKQYDG